MFQIKITNNNGSESVLSFAEFSRKSVVAKYNQLVSEGSILDFEIGSSVTLWVSVVTARIKSIKRKVN